MAYCGYCGRPVANILQFCPYCGKEITQREVPATQSQRIARTVEPTRRRRTVAPVASGLTVDTALATARQRARQKRKTGGSRVAQGIAGLLVAGLIIAIISVLAPPPASTSQSPAAQRAAQRAAFGPFAAQFFGASQPCDNASKTAQASFNAVLKGGDLLTAYRDAGTAHDACSNASLAFAMLSVPDALSADSYHLSDAVQDAATAANERSDMWGNIQSILQSPGDLASQSNLLDNAKTAQTAETLASAWIAEAAISLNVAVAKITPIIPTPSS